MVLIEGHWPNIQYPRTPGHEVIGVVDKLGTAVSGFAVGQRVGVGWYGGATAGDVVAIQGLGGLGHLAVQFANKMGFRTVALSRGKDKEQQAYELGAHVYIDTTTQDPAAELKKLGGARVILATAPNSQAITALLGGLAYEGKLLVVAGGSSL